MISPIDDYELLAHQPHLLDPAHQLALMRSADKLNLLNLFVYNMGWNLLPARLREAELYIIC